MLRPDFQGQVPFAATASIARYHRINRQAYRLRHQQNISEPTILSEPMAAQLGGSLTVNRQDRYDCGIEIQKVTYSRP